MYKKRGEDYLFYHYNEINIATFYICWCLLSSFINYGSWIYAISEYHH